MYFFEFIFVSSAAQMKSLCLTEMQIVQFLKGTLSNQDFEQVESHLDACATCRKLWFRMYGQSLGLEHTLQLLPQSAHTRTLSPGEQVGRFKILEKIGQGGVGIVYAAYDPNLDRRVAIKILKRPRQDSAVSEKLLKEAQIMARLHHHSINTVYDVGEHQGQSYLVMCFIAGDTLDEWLKTTKRTHQSIISLFLSMAEGLAEAHRAGIVHGDFKPKNILIDVYNKAYVIDFGVAQVLTESITPQHIQGTPAYMAPELLQGVTQTDKSDQFSFCVTLFQALMGELPFQSPVLSKRREAIYHFHQQHKSLKSAFIKKQIPAYVLNVIIRGLSENPLDRYPDMQSLAQALRNHPLKKWYRLMSAAGLFLIALFLGMSGYKAYWDYRYLCKHGDDEISLVWNDKVKKNLRSILNTQSQDDTFLLLSLIDDYVKNWAHLHDEICAATHIKKTQSIQLMDVKLDCLDLGKQELIQTLDLLEQHQNTPDKALPAVRALSSLEYCLKPILTMTSFDPEFKPILVNKEPKQEERRRSFVRALALANTGFSARAVSLLQPIKEDILSHAYTRLDAQILSFLGGEYIRTNQNLEDAKRMLDAAVFLSEKLGDDLGTIKALLNQTSTLIRSHEIKEAKAAFKHAESLIARNWSSDGVVLSYWMVKTDLEEMTGQKVAALESIMQAVHKCEQPLLDKVNNKLCAQIFISASMNLLSNEQYELGLKYAQLGYQYYVSLWGLHNLETLYVSSNLANAYLNNQAEDQALTIMKQSYQELVRVLGPNLPGQEDFFVNYAVILEANGEYQTATLLLEQTLIQLRKKQHLPAYIQAVIKQTLASIYENQDLFKQALDTLAQSDIANMQEEIPRNQLESYWLLRALLLVESHRFKEAQYVIDRIERDILPQALSNHSSDVLSSYYYIKAQWGIQTGRIKNVEYNLRQALENRIAAKGNQASVARIKLELGQFLLTKKQHTQAMPLIKDAHALFCARKEAQKRCTLAKALMK